MKQTNILRFWFLPLIVLFLFSCDTWKPDLQHAHSKAQMLMTDPFLWSSNDETAPFGNDDGSDAIFDYYKWRLKHSERSNIEFIKLKLVEWNYKVYDYYTIDTNAIRTFIKSNKIGDRIYLGIDDLIISIGFGQFIIEGKIDPDLKSLTLIALQRQLLSISLELFDLNYRAKRIKELNRMNEIINAA